MKQDIIDNARKYAIECHKYTDACHDFSHVERVLKTSLKLAKEENADLFIVELASLLHDIGRKNDNIRSASPDRHEEISAQMAQPFLLEQGLDTETTQRIVEAILEHRHRRGKGPTTIEAKCLFDADKLDSIGMVGLARAYLWLGKHGRGLYYKHETWENIDPTNNETKNDSFQREWEIKLSKLKDKLYTKTGKELAIKRHEKMKYCLDEIEKEVNGLC